MGDFVSTVKVERDKDTGNVIGWDSLYDMISKDGGDVRKAKDLQEEVVDTK